MRTAEKAAVGTRCVHVIDREGNAVYYLRQWNKQKRLFLVRSDYTRLVRHEGEECNVRTLAQLLASRGKFRYVRDVRYQAGGRRRKRSPRRRLSWTALPTNSVRNMGPNATSDFAANPYNCGWSSVASSTRNTNCLPNGTC